MPIQTQDNNKRIAKNTLLLYCRMLFMMAVSLYTSRVVLNTLGVEDFGIYNVVGGVVAMFGFINSAMAIGTQRYLTFELGRKNYEQLSKVFFTSVLIHALIASLLVLLAETIGLWFIEHKMTIPPERMNVTFWVYQFSILSTIVMIMSVPYNASIIAHEKMTAFAYISVLEVVLKLLIVYLLQFGKFDKLKSYAILMFVVQLSIRFIYVFYCKRHFVETKCHRVWDMNLFKEMLRFAGWNLWGNCAAIAYTQGVNILLNIFFGPIVNAARGVSVQVQGAVSQFSYNFQMAINPQITKSYAIKDYAYMHNLIIKSAKYTFFMLSFLSLPIMLETEMILNMWLKVVPDYTVSFLRIMLCITIIDAVSNSLMVSAMATGKIRLYQSVVGGILLAILPVSYVVLKMGGNPVSVFIVHICICIVAFLVRLYIIAPMIKLSPVLYIKDVVSRCLLIVLLAFIPSFFLKCILPDGLFYGVLVCVCSVTFVILAFYTIGLTISERAVLRIKLDLIKKRLFYKFV